MCDRARGVRDIDGLVARRTLKLWQLILAGPFLIWAGISEYGKLDDLEQLGGRIYVGRTTKLLYSLGGKHLAKPGAHREPPPRLNDDPFRSPPVAPPIVATPTYRPVATPIVVTDTPEDGPKLL